MTSRLLCVVATTTVLASAQAVNSASFRLSGMPGYGVARGSMFVLFGERLGPAGLEKAQSVPLETNLAGTTVQVTVGSTSVAAFIYYTSASQVAAVLPSTTPVGDGIVVLTYNGRRSNPISIRVAESAFGIFTRNQAGFGPGIAQNFIDAATTPTNALNTSLEPGQTAVLWGTGVGPISGSDADIPPVGNRPTDAVVLIGGHTVKPDYAGRTGSYPAIDQINFKVPEGVTGCFVPVAVKAGGVVSNYVSVSIAPNGGSCSDLTTYAARDIDTAAQSGQSRIGAIVVTGVAEYDPSTGLSRSTESGLAEFRARSLSAFLAARGPLPPVGPMGTCTATTFRVDPSDRTTVNPPDPVDTTMLNAGLAIAVQGYSLPRASNGSYSGSLPTGTLSPGPVTIQGGRDGADVGSFRTSITLPEPISWSNMASLVGTAISRGQELRVTWSGGNSAREFVVVRGISTTPDGNIRGSFSCAESVDARSFTVPVDVLSVLPPGNSTGPDFLEVGTATRLDTSRFDASGMDGGYVQVRRFQRAPVVFQ